MTEHSFLSSNPCAATVLVVDDNEAHCTGLAELLALEGFHTLCAFGGRDGLDLTKRLRPDAILLDLELGDLHGIDVCRAIRADSELDRTAKIFHTGHRETAFPRHEADAFLTFPIDRVALAYVIRGRIANRRNILIGRKSDDGR